MKKYISLIAAAAALILAGCTKATEGTEPGNDAQPNVAIYQYSPGAEYNPDNDVAIKIAANNKVDEVYYMIIPADSYKADIDAKGENAVADYIKSNGTKAELAVSEFDDAKVFSTILTGIQGTNEIVAAGFSSSASSLANTSFTGLSWTKLASGTFSSETMAKLGLGPVPASLEKCDQIEGRYRFPDLFAKGYHRVFEIVGEAQKDTEGDTFYTVKVANQETGLSYGNYGAISARDVATWQSSSDYLVYNSFYPDYNYVIIWTQYNVTAGNLGYGDDIFQPAE